MRAYLTLLGRSTWALINSYYAVVEERGFKPEKVIVYSEKNVDEPRIVSTIKSISKAYHFDPIVEWKVVPEGDFLASGNAVSGDLKRLKGEGYETALDITPGRKALVAGAILSASRQHIDHIYYLMIDSTEDADEPYLLIPRKRQTLIDFAEEAKEVHPVTHEATIRGDELQLLLNLPYPEFEVTYPLTGIPLLRATQVREGVRIRVLANSTSFDEGTDSDLWRRERPTWNDLLECYLASGALSYLNLEEFGRAMHGYSRVNHLYYAPDTNILYGGFLTNSGLVDANKVLLSGTVKEEIRAHLNAKHGVHHIDELKHSTQYNRTLWEMLLNQRMKQSRKAAALALAEYDVLSSHALLIESAAQTSSDKERNDDVFTRTISAYKASHGVIPVVLTCDAAMVDYCKIENLEYFLFQLPRTIESSTVSHRCFMKLIHKLANVFGFLKVGKVTILGEYQGRRGADELKVIFPNGDYDWFIKHLGLSRELVNLQSA